MNNSLEFLKITSLIKYRLYSQEMPWIVSYQFTYKNLRQINFLFQTGEQPSAIELAKFLNLKLNSHDLATPQWFCNEPRSLVTNWLQDFQISVQHHRTAMKVIRIFSVK